MDHNECIQKNHETGRLYMNLGEQTMQLANKFKAKTQIADTNWDFNKLYVLYSDLAIRLYRIGQALKSI